jgi:glycosyltransferase involved in cell wall biosynthesis
MNVSILVPVYRAEATLPELHRQLSAVMPTLVDDHEIIFVEDCGGDDSWRVITDLAATDPRVRGIRMSRNYSQHNALLAGIRAAQYEVVMTVDDDLQHPVSEIGPMLAALTDDLDVVYGAPEREQHDFLRDMASRLTKLALSEAWAPKRHAVSVLLGYFVLSCDMASENTAVLRFPLMSS